MSRSAVRPRTLPGQVARLARRHELFGAVLLAAAAVRVVAMFGFRGAFLYPDSADYVSVALRMQPHPIRPSGYPAMLWLLKPFHSLAAVVGVQHAMGLVIGVAGYTLLRRAGLPGWGATLAMVPALLSAYAIQIEHFLLSDTLFAFLVMIAVAAMMWWPEPPVWVCALAGLLLAAATLVRSQGLPLLIVFLACLLVRFAGWRTTAGALVMCVAFGIPVACYAAWFNSVHGTVGLTDSDGALFYAAVIPFADCATIKPPAAERRLCLNVPVSERNYPTTYVWSSSPIRAVPGGEFGKLANRLGTDFALRAIRAQPLDYLRAVWLAFWESFLPHRNTHSTATLPRISAQLQHDYMFSTSLGPPPRYADLYYDAYDPADADLRAVQPYAGWVLVYQRYIVIAGPLLGVITLTGLAGLIVAWRRIGGPALLPWLTGSCLLAAPAAVANFDPRDVVCTIAPLCVAAAIGIQQIAGLATRFRAGQPQSALLCARLCWAPSSEEQRHQHDADHDRARHIAEKLVRDVDEDAQLLARDYCPQGQQPPVLAAPGKQPHREVGQVTPERCAP